MIICEGMYFILGAQLCKYIGFSCPYQGDQASLKLKNVEGAVTYCTLNNIENIILEEKKGDPDKGGQKDL